MPVCHWKIDRTACLAYLISLSICTGILVVDVPVRSVLIRCKLVQMKFHRSIGHFCRRFHVTSGKIVVSPEVSKAVAAGKGTVALESTVITHGMPYPENLQTALQLEQIVRDENCVPATVAVLDGCLKIGLNETELVRLAKLQNPLKISRRDISVALANGFSGGTTVSATLFAAERSNISVFATGGIGGVHRGVEETFDISADLKELGRTPVAVVSAGIKSILDVGRTLEYLETEGVTVISIGSDFFPGFFVAMTDLKPQFSVPNAEEAAKILAQHLQCQVQSGILFAVPIPPEDSTNAAVIEAAIQSSLEAAKTMGVCGKDITPFVLDRLNEHTGGMSLKANIALIKNNARTAGKIANHLAALRTPAVNPTATVRTSCGNSNPKNISSAPDRPQVVVVGGVTADFYAKEQVSVKPDGGTYEASISQSFGGVGRNHAEGLARLGTTTLLISTVGADQMGLNFAHSNQPNLNLSGIKVSDQLPTATYIGIFNRNDASVQYGLMDSRVFREMSADHVRQHEKEISEAKLVLLDGNVPTETVRFLCDLCHSVNTPVWFEPTDRHKLSKIFHANCLPLISYISPNQSELVTLMDCLKVKAAANLAQPIQADSNLSALSPVFHQIFQSAPLLRLLRMTFGSKGCTIIEKTDSSKLKGITICPPSPPAIINSSGAGDSWNVGLIHGIVRDWPLIHSASLGLSCAHQSLQSSHPISPILSPQLVKDLQVLQPNFVFEL